MREVASKWLVWLAGGWIFLTLWMTYVAVGNFRLLRPDRLRNADVVYAGIPAGDERTWALKYAASELNRHYFRVYAWAQLGVGFAALALAALPSRRRRKLMVVLGLALALAIPFATWVVPQIVEAGRAIDFVQRDPDRSEVARFHTIHKVAVAVDGAKLALLAWLSVVLLRGGRGADGDRQGL